MDDFNFTIKIGSGKYNTLDKAYGQFLRKTLLDLDEDKKYRWAIYNLIINEFLDFGDTDSFNEIKYRITDGENPNVVILSILNRDRIISPTLWLMKKKLDEFADEDFYARFR